MRLVSPFAILEYRMGNLFEEFVRSQEAYRQEEADVDLQVRDVCLLGDRSGECGNVGTVQAISEDEMTKGFDE